MLLLPFQCTGNTLISCYIVSSVLLIILSKDLTRERKYLREKDLFKVLFIICIKQITNISPSITCPLWRAVHQLKSFSLCVTTLSGLIFFTRNVRQHVKRKLIGLAYPWGCINCKNLTKPWGVFYRQTFFDDQKAYRLKYFHKCLFHNVTWYTVSEKFNRQTFGKKF